MLVFALTALIPSDVAAQSDSPEARLARLGIEHPPAPDPVANYVNGVRTGNLIFLAGKGPRRADGTEISGKLGADLSIEQGYEAARLTAINQLAVLKEMIGDLGRVVRIVKVLGMVNSDPSFVDQPAVINGFSDLMVEVFRERGRHARGPLWEWPRYPAVRPWRSRWSWRFETRGPRRSECHEAGSGGGSVLPFPHRGGHLARLVFGVGVTVGSLAVPMWPSLLATIGPAGLAIWLWKEQSR
ncbi:MAG: RidA family protein [Chromatiales bacterium]|nr:RidA family protein [Chromatiales bacterium]